MGYRYTSSIEIYKSLNGIKSFKPISDLELQIVFTKNDTTLTLYFDNYTKTLAGATVGVHKKEGIVRPKLMMDAWF